ncbi:GNAT family N-acetyltransferase [Niabella sp. 22666]|uniref:GNAT family N-acetyltransferase n=1 Tax=Niabella sp. 22666 TaxID=3453954 RepID=UPI003F85E31C
MIKATLNDEAIIVDILTKSFEANQSVNYIIRQDKSKKRRLRQLINYSFKVCLLNGEVYLSDDKVACALCLFPEKKGNKFKKLILDLELIIKVTGLGKLSKALKRETAIEKVMPHLPLYHIWYIGVEPMSQGKGHGSKLLQAIIDRASVLNRTAVLETSTERNLPWYTKFGFKIYNQLEFDYTLYLLQH